MVDLHLAQGMAACHEATVTSLLALRFAPGQQSRVHQEGEHVEDCFFTVSRRVALPSTTVVEDSCWTVDLGCIVRHWMVFW